MASARLMTLLDSLRRSFRPDSLADLPHIETARLRIAALKPDDASEVQAITDDPAVTSAVDFLPERVGIEEAQRLIGTTPGGKDIFLGVRERGTAALVGIVGTHLRGERAVEIGYWIGGAARGRGFGGEAVGAIVAALAKRFPRRHIVAECRAENAASVGLLTKVGFRDTGEEGHRPGRTVYVWERG